MKILKDELRTTPAFIERFRAEARHAAGLSHPGIATVYDYGETDEVAYLVMELVPGQTLSELLVDQPALPTATKLSILSQTADALHAAHRAGVIHRDVKPANLIVGPDGTVKVTDFGIARAIGAAPLTEAGQVIGTAHYMSPEQATGNQATSASDIYSLGVIAYEMFAGRRPFEADTPLGDLHGARPRTGPCPASGGASRRRRSDPGGARQRSRVAAGIGRGLRRTGATRDARWSPGAHAHDSGGNRRDSRPAVAGANRWRRRGRDGRRRPERGESRHGTAARIPGGDPADRRRGVAVRHAFPETDPSVARIH